MPDRRADAWVLGSLIFFCIVLATGRLGSADTPGLIQAGLRLHVTGSFSAPAPFGPAAFNWVKAPNGSYYECHDLGGQLMGWLAAEAAGWFDPNLAWTSLWHPKLVWCASILNNLMAAFTVWMIYKSARVFLPLRSAVGLSIAMLFCTFFVGYCRSVFDVTGAAMGVSIAAYGSIRLLHSDSPRLRDLLIAVIGFGIAALFRYSFLPFAGLTLVILWWQLAARFNWRQQAIAVLLFVVLVVPSFAFNYIRTGNPFDPPVHSAELAFNGLRLTPAGIAKGLFGLTFSPNRGFFIYAPWLVIALLLPTRWGRLPLAARRFVIAWTPGLIGYVLFLSPITAWGGNGGWGPRYLLVILPAVVLLAAIACQAAGRSRLERYVLIGLLAVGALVNLPVAVENFTVALNDAPYNHAQGVPWPAAPVAAWRAIALETFGDGVNRTEWQRRIDSGAFEQVETAGTSVFPDLPVLTRGLVAPLFIRIPLIVVLAAGLVCFIQTLRLILPERYGETSNWRPFS